MAPQQRVRSAASVSRTRSKKASSSFQYPTCRAGDIACRRRRRPAAAASNSQRRIASKATGCNAGLAGSAHSNPDYLLERKSFDWSPGHDEAVEFLGFDLAPPFVEFAEVLWCRILSCICVWDKQGDVNMCWRPAEHSQDLGFGRWLHRHKIHESYFDARLDRFLWNHPDALRCERGKRWQLWVDINRHLPQCGRMEPPRIRARGSRAKGCDSRHPRPRAAAHLISPSRAHFWRWPQSRPPRPSNRASERFCEKVKNRIHCWHRAAAAVPISEGTPLPRAGAGAAGPTAPKSAAAPFIVAAAVTPAPEATLESGDRR